VNFIKIGIRPFSTVFTIGGSLSKKEVLERENGKAVYLWRGVYEDQ